MRKSLVLAASLVTMVCTAQNIATNSSFENDMSGWNQNIDANSGANASFNIVEAGHEGANALQATVEKLGANEWDVMLMQDLGTKKGQYYELSLYAKATTANKNIRLQFQNKTYTSKDVELTSEWAPYTFGINAKEDNLQFVIQFLKEGTYHIDNIIIEQKEKPVKALLQNGSFEEEMEAWNTNIDGGAAADVNIVNGGQTGAKALQANIKALGKNPWDISLVQQLSTVAGEFYELKFQGKSTIPGKKVRLQFQNTTYTSSDVALTTDWAEYTFGTVAKEDDLQIAFQFFEKDTFYIDNITLVKKDASSLPLIQNGGFEKEGEGWNNNKDNGANAIFSYSEDTPAEGKKAQLCLVLLKGKNPWDIQTIASFPAKRYKKYRLSFYAKASTVGTRLKAQIQKTTYTPKDFTLTTEWKKYEFVFNAKENDMQAAFHYLDTGLYYLDDVKMELLSKSKSKKKKKKKKR